MSAIRVGQYTILGFTFLFILCSCNNQRYGKYAGIDGLCEASGQGDTAAVKHLLDSGVDVNGYNAEGRTPLICAAGLEQQTTLEMLIAAGANVDAVDAGHGSMPSLGICALHTAALQGSDVIVDTLLKADANPNLADKAGNTPLHWVLGYPGAMTKPVIQQKVRIIHLLLEAGADPKSRNSMGSTPIETAESNGETELRSALVSKKTD